METKEVSNEARTENRLGYSVATLVVVGAVSTTAQWLAASSLGLPLEAEWSTGGLVALISSIWMGVKCRSWSAWRKWVWIPIAITAIIAIGVINVLAAETEKFTAPCTDAQITLNELESSFNSILDSAWAASGDVTGSRPIDWAPTQVDASAPSWREAFSEEIEIKDSRPAMERQWLDYVSAGGPELELAINLQQSVVATTCNEQ